MVQRDSSIFVLVTLPSRVHSAACPLGGSAAGIHTHLAVRSYGHLAGDDDVFSRGYTLANHDVIALPLAQGHKPQVCGVVGFYHVNERTILADLRGLVWD